MSYLYGLRYTGIPTEIPLNRLKYPGVCAIHALFVINSSLG